MSEGIAWDLLAQYPNAGQAFEQSFQKGQQENEQAVYRNALASLSATTPGQEASPNALAAVYAENPTVGMAMEKQIHDRVGQARQASFRSAEAQMILGDQPPASGHSGMQNALPGYAPAQSPAMQRSPQSQDRHAAWAAYAGSLAKWADTPEKWDQAIDHLLSTNHPDISTPDLLALKGHFNPALRQSFMALGGAEDDTAPSPDVSSQAPSEAQRQAITADPEAYLTFQGKRLGLTKGQLKVASDINTQAMQILGGVHDDASLQAAKDQARQLYQAYGVDPSPIDAIPDAYDPQTIHDLQMRGMNTSQQLEAVARENRVKMYGDNMAADNARADRSEQSLEGYRTGQLDLGRDRLNRPPNARAAPAPKQPTPSTVVGGIMAKQASGQPLTPAEQATLVDYRTRHKPQSGAVQVSPNEPVATDAHGNKLVVRNGKWVPAQ